jgi:hypothetical protein
MKGINPLKALALFLIFVCSSGIILAQNGTVTGRV